jgi:GYF domain 2
MRFDNDWRTRRQELFRAGLELVSEIVFQYQTRQAAKYTAYSLLGTASMKYERPILTKVLYPFGVATIIIGVIAGAVICADSLSEGIAIITGSIFAGIIYIGIGQAVDFLARTAFSTDRVCTIMETSMTNIQPPSPTTSPRPAAVFHFVLDGVNKGPLTSAEMQDFYKRGLIAGNTPVFREGEVKWRTYLDFFTGL